MSACQPHTVARQKHSSGDAGIVETNGPRLPIQFGVEVGALRVVERQAGSGVVREAKLKAKHLWFNLDSR